MSGQTFIQGGFGDQNYWRDEFHPEEHWGIIEDIYSHEVSVCADDAWGGISAADMDVKKYMKNFHIQGLQFETKQWFSPDIEESKKGIEDISNCSVYFGIACYSSMGEEPFKMKIDQGMKLEYWIHDFDIDRSQTGQFLCFISEQFHSRKVSMWQLDAFPCQGGSGGKWIVEARFLGVHQNYLGWPAEMEVGDTSFDNRIIKKFGSWSDAKQFYELVRHVDIDHMPHLIDSNKPVFQYGKISNGDSGIHWKSVGEVFNWTCHICGEKVDRIGGTPNNRRGCTVEHIVPQSKGGANTWNNVRPAHWECNIFKSANI